VLSLGALLSAYAVGLPAAERQLAARMKSGLVTAEARRYQLSAEQVRTGIGDDDSAVVGFATFDEGHPVLDVGVGCRIVGEQTLPDPIQLGLAVGGPHEVLDAARADTVAPGLAF